jgi:hypothetical protein
LERIAQSVAGNDTPLDLQSLKNLADDAGAQRGSALTADVSSQSSDFDGVDEKFSMQPLQDNITRETSTVSQCLSQIDD